MSVTTSQENDGAGMLIFKKNIDGCCVEYCYNELNQLVLDPSTLSQKSLVLAPFSTNKLQLQFAVGSVVSFTESHVIIQLVRQSQTDEQLQLQREQECSFPLISNHKWSDVYLMIAITSQWNQNTMNSNSTKYTNIISRKGIKRISCTCGFVFDEIDTYGHILFRKSVIRKTITSEWRSHDAQDNIKTKTSINTTNYEAEPFFNGVKTVVLTFNQSSYILICDNTINTNTSTDGIDTCINIKVPTMFQRVCAENSKQYLQCIIGLDKKIIDSSIQAMNHQFTNNINNSSNHNSNNMDHLKLSFNDILDKFVVSTQKKYQLKQLVAKVILSIDVNEMKKHKLLNISSEEDVERIILLKLIIYDMNVNKVIKYLYNDNLCFECLNSRVHGVCCKYTHHKNNTFAGSYDYSYYNYSSDCENNNDDHDKNKFTINEKIGANFTTTIDFTNNKQHLTLDDLLLELECVSKHTIETPNDAYQLLCKLLVLFEYLIHLYQDDSPISQTPYWLSIIPFYLRLLYRWNTLCDVRLKWNDSRNRNFFIKYLFHCLKLKRGFDYDNLKIEYKQLWDVEYMYGKYLAEYQQKYQHAAVFFELSKNRYIFVNEKEDVNAYDKKMKKEFKNFNITHENGVDRDSQFLDGEFILSQLKHRLCYAKLLIERLQMYTKASAILLDVWQKFRYYCSSDSTREIYGLAARSALKQSKINEAVLLANSVVDITGVEGKCVLTHTTLAQTSLFDIYILNQQKDQLQKAINDIDNCQYKSTLISLFHCKFWLEKYEFDLEQTQKQKPKQSRIAKEDWYDGMIKFHSGYAGYWNVMCGHHSDIDPDRYKATINSNFEKVITHYQLALKYSFECIQICGNRNPYIKATCCRLMKDYNILLLQNWKYIPCHMRVLIEKFFIQNEKDILAFLQCTHIRSFILLFFQMNQCQHAYSQLDKLSCFLHNGDSMGKLWINIKDSQPGCINYDLVMTSVAKLRDCEVVPIQCLLAATESKYLKQCYGLYSAKSVSKNTKIIVDINNNDKNNKSEYILVGAMFLNSVACTRVMMRNDKDYWNFNLAFGIPPARIDIKTHQESIREVRTSLFVLSQQMIKNKNKVVDYLYWHHLSLLSIGIHSLLSFKITKFASIDKNDAVKYHYNSIMKYLNKFVIKYISDNLVFPITYDTSLICFGYACLMLCYFVLGDKNQFSQTLKNFNDEKLKFFDKGKHAVIRIDKYWYDIQYFKKKIGRIKSKKTRILIFVEVMKRMNALRDPRSDKRRIVISSNMEADIRSTETIFSLLNAKTRLNKDYLRWRNKLVQKKVQCHYCQKSCDEYQLKLCSKCKNTYYCSKICQKKDWNLRFHKIACIEK